MPKLSKVRGVSKAREYVEHAQSKKKPATHGEDHAPNEEFLLHDVLRTIMLMHASSCPICLAGLQSTVERADFLGLNMDVALL
jgi:hypothetical protein